MSKKRVYEKQDVPVTEYCQSCGMPFRFGHEELLGTNTDMSPSSEYCYLCLREGIWINNFTIGQMIDIWVEHTPMYNEISGTDYSPDALRKILMERLPALKRWHGESQVVRFHRQAIWNVRKYIGLHLNDSLLLERLCLVANMSSSHLRRVFKQLTGESIGEYIQRQRLEYVAHRLLTTDSPVVELLMGSGYHTKHSLAKAFTTHFGTPPIQYRKKNAGMTVTPDDPAADRDRVPTEPYHIKKLSAVHVVCLELDNAYRTLDQYRLLWKRFIHELVLAGVSTRQSEFVSISRDNPLVTPREKRSFLLGATVGRDAGPLKHFTVYTRPSGLYAVFRHTGGYDTLPELYREIYEGWLPGSAFHPVNAMSMECYVSMPLEDDRQELITDIYIPVKKK
ncbi:GyrI-like domain-containing protein [Parabacteroides segnis]|uniref:GyrI-like domain-containing protein n=1 Tax=Parabacteroides segnis TaxID=2763058 RepID=UPI0035140E68